MFKLLKVMENQWTCMHRYHAVKLSRMAEKLQKTEILSLMVHERCVT